jgi:Tfp pilus assembly protein FimT
MVVMVVVGVLLAVAVVSVSSSGYAGTVRGFGSEIAAEADNARLRAVASRRWQQLQLRAGDTGHWEVNHWAATSEGLAQPGAGDWVLVRRLFAPRDVIVTGFEEATRQQPGNAPPSVGDEALVTFSPDGSMSEPATIYLGNVQDTHRARVIFYRATGTAYVFEGW